MDVRDDAAARDRRLDQRVELLVTADRELEVARRDALHLEGLARVARELEHLGREVLEDGRRVHGRRGAHALRRRHAQLEEEQALGPGVGRALHIALVSGAVTYVMWVLVGTVAWISHLGERAVWLSAA